MATVRDNFDSFDMWHFHWRHWTAEDRAIAARFKDSLRSATHGDARDAQIMAREATVVRLFGMPDWGAFNRQLGNWPESEGDHAQD